MVRAKRKIAAAMTERMAHGLVALGVERDVLRQRVEELCDGLVAIERILYDAARVEQADVQGVVDDVVHEENVGGEVVARADMEALERDEASGLAPLDADPGLVQLCGRANDIRHNVEHAVLAEDRIIIRIFSSHGRPFGPRLEDLGRWRGPGQVRHWHVGPGLGMVRESARAPSLRGGRGDTEYLQHEAPVHDHELEELGRVVAPIRHQPVLGVHEVLGNGGEGVHVDLERPTGALEEVEERAALVLLHLTQVAAPVVVRPQGDDLRLVGPGVDVGHGGRDPVDRPLAPVGRLSRGVGEIFDGLVGVDYPLHWPGLGKTSMLEQMEYLFQDNVALNSDIREQDRTNRGRTVHKISYYDISRNLLIKFKDDSIDETPRLGQNLSEELAISSMLDMSIRYLPGDHGLNLDNGEGEEEDGGYDRQNGPRIREVGVHEVCPPLVPRLLAILTYLQEAPCSYLLVHLLKAALGVERDVLRQRVEQLGDGLVAAERVLYDAARVEQADVHRAVDDVVHEEDIRGEVVARAHVEALERDEVEVERLERVVHHDQGEPQHPPTERDVLEAPGLATLDADPGLVELRGRADDVVTALVGGGRSPRLLLLGARLLEKEALAVYV
ncbi:hypothetical protein SASPL_157522 [Salvia splendens]|uniref:Uncharacterized protein n=1 Tax=Salvia splendens TaxID=180675 RepID=A0A8X8YUV6_SALSN|nr:hypothetical protein SASPL_157522 [Salvia splendens]